MTTRAPKQAVSLELPWEPGRTSGEQVGRGQARCADTFSYVFNILHLIYPNVHLESYQRPKIYEGHRKMPLRAEHILRAKYIPLFRLVTAS